MPKKSQHCAMGQVNKKSNTKKFGFKFRTDFVSENGYYVQCYKLALPFETSSTYKDQ